MTGDEKVGEWNEWRRLVFAELQRHDKEIEHLTRQQLELQVKMQTLVVKMGVFTALASAVGGMLASVVTGFIVWHLTR